MGHNAFALLLIFLFFTKERISGMLGSTWKLTLEISTFLGGLAALVFFFDRFFRHQVRIGSDNAELSESSRKIWSAGIMVFCIASCSAMGIIGLKFGLPIYIWASLGYFFGSAPIVWLLRVLGLQRLGDAAGYVVISAGTAAMTSGIVAVIVNAIMRGQHDDLTSYPGSPLSIFIAVLCPIEGILLRRYWFFEDP